MENTGAASHAVSEMCVVREAHAGRTAEQSQREKRSDFSDGNTRIARSPSCETRPAGAPQDEVEQVEWSKDRARSDRNELLLVVRSVAQRRVSNHGPRAQQVHKLSGRGWSNRA